MLFNPYPDLVHDNIYGVARGIGSALDVAMNSLHARLPVAVEEAAPPPPTVSPSLADATAHAATEVLLTAAESEKNVVPPPGAPPAPSKGIL